jgi:hypothetical protein
MSTYGTYQTRLLQDATDRLGVRKVVLVQPFPADYTAPRFGAPDLPPWARDLRIPVTETDTSPVSPGTLQIKWTLEGHDGTSTFPPKTRRDTDELSIETGFVERPLTTLPEWPELMAEQGLEIDPASGRIKWPAAAPGTAAPGGFAPTDKAKVAPSPWYGAQTWRDITCVISADYIVRTKDEITTVFPFSKIDVATKSIDRNLFAGIADQIARALSTLRNKTADTREWRLMPPGLRVRGNVYQIRESYELSPPGGWIRANKSK